MSKFTKLVSNPRLFFMDALAQRLDRAGSSGTPELAVKKPVAKPGDPKHDLSRGNPLGGYSMILHSGEAADGLFHLMPWIPAFVRTGVRFVVLTRTVGLYKAVVAQFPKLDVVCIASPTDVDRFILAHRSLRFVCYTSNTGNNIHLVRHNHLTHVFIGHGDSDKAASAHKVFRMYDEIWTAGQAHQDRLRNAGFPITDVRFCEVGRPNASVGFAMAAHPWKKRIETGLRILYLPTWEGFFAENDYTSLSFAADILLGTAEAFPEARVWAKFHPFTGKRVAAFASMAEGLTLRVQERGMDERVRAIPATVPIEEVIPDANLFVCDVSAVVTDCLVADCPIFVYVPEGRPIVLAQSEMSYEQYTYVFSSLDQLHSEIRSVLTGGDRLAEARKLAREYILGVSATERDAFRARVLELAASEAVSPA
jgi:hypothetical protein